MRIHRIIGVIALFTFCLGLSCANEEIYVTPEPKDIETQQFKDLDRYLWNYLLPEEDVAAESTAKTVVKAVEFWQYLADRTFEPSKRAKKILQNVSRKLSVGKYVFPEIMSNNLTLLQDFIKFIDENRILRSIRKNNLLFRTIKLEEFKQLHPKLQQECIKQVYVEDFAKEMLEGAQLIILCEKNLPIENILVLLIKPQIFDEIRDKDKLFSLPELKIYYTILSISSYPYTETN